MYALISFKEATSATGGQSEQRKHSKLSESLSNALPVVPSHIA